MVLLVVHASCYRGIMATDFRSDDAFPRRGRLPFGRFLWLARVFDKARASAQGTIGEYIYPCPIDRGVMERWGITREEFEAAVSQHADDESILAWVQSKVSNHSADRANSWVCTEWFENLDRQDREERYAA